MAKFRKGKAKRIVAGVLACVLGVGAIAGISALVSSKADDDGKVKVNPSYSIGGLDENGKYVESDATLYTKDAFECQGLSIKPNFDSNVKYQIFFYDEIGSFIESSDVLSASYNEDVPKNASHARLEITPVWSDDVKEKDQVIKWYNKHQWEKSLEIRVDKEQVVVSLPYQGENKFAYSQACAFNMNLGVEGFYLKDFGSGSYNACELVRVDNADKICIKIQPELLSDVKLIALSKNEYLFDRALNVLEYEEKIIEDDFYIIINVDDTWAGISLYSNTDVDFSNTELYVF